MGHLSILWPNGPSERPIPDVQPMPAYFRDLNLDQMAEKMRAGNDNDDAAFLTSLLCEPERDADTVRYRQEIFRDVDRQPGLVHLGQFVESMRSVRRRLAAVKKMESPQERDGWFLDGVATYCQAVRLAATRLEEVHPGSRGLSAMKDYLVSYVHSGAFSALEEETRTLQGILRRVRFCIRIYGGTVHVSRYEGQDDYSISVLETFERFRQGTPKDYTVLYRNEPGMTHVASQIIGYVAKLFPDTFERLSAFSLQNRMFLDPEVLRFSREVQFYLSYLKYIEPIKECGLSFCYPGLTDRSGNTVAVGTFDLTLAHQRALEQQPIVTNDVRLEGPERVLLVSGPNQGGKTTFARCFGQLHYLVRLGVPVPGKEALLTLCDNIFCHFQREETITSMSGKLEDDIRRTRDIFVNATSNSVLVFNEIFSSTTLRDARFLGLKLMKKLNEIGSIACLVTFIDGLSDENQSVVTMMSTVSPTNPSERTYRVIRAPADGLAYALALAEKNGVTYSQLRNRLGK